MPDSARKCKPGREGAGSRFELGPPAAIGYRGGMSPTDSHINAAAQYVSGPGSPPASDLCDWSKGQMVIMVDWQVLLLNDVVILAGFGLIVWLILRNRK
jgi:hypothetical protein